MAEIAPELITAIFTIVLAFATVGLIVATVGLTRATREVGREAERLKILPSLTFQSTAYYYNGGRHQVRFNIKNIGYGHAKNPSAKARLAGGPDLVVTPYSTGTYIEKDVGLYTWDIFDGAKMGDKVELEISYSDLKDKEYPAYKYDFTVKVE